MTAHLSHGCIVYAYGVEEKAAALQSPIPPPGLNKSKRKRTLIACNNYLRVTIDLTQSVVRA